MKKYLELPLRILFMVSGILFVFALPTLIGIGESLSINFKPFWKFVEINIEKLTQINDPQFISLYEQMNMAESYRYSMTIVFAALLVVIIVGVIGAIMVKLSPKKLGSLFKKVIDFFESVPDLLVIFLFMFFVITLYKTTGLKFLQLYGIFGHKPYFVPIITISFLPTLFFMQFLIKALEGEESRDYVLYLKAKGMRKFRILLIHMIRNIFPILIIQLRTSIWIILSNLYLLEFMFNINGFTKTFPVAMGMGEFLLLVICLLLFTLPLLIVEAISLLVLKFFKGKESVSL
ncbi:peptide/nickel transport system permease protein [Bacillus sp. SORGH_AS 510]|uniref:ABC transporter permease subunit n=1 Tax=Bacillus sp. SORGH_AS_0510 TaxID=3041771 RepID=UPI0027831970|nr:ABC transporter permease subunit [Bacillus sp. SORGH_AS_0510]MDQ1146553.1 peptide/nickel transport system permease protein [Bacillus sp. SORGH_AS_0510]